jgi:hypothetical protein
LVHRNNLCLETKFISPQPLFVQSLHLAYLAAPLNHLQSLLVQALAWLLMTR